MNSIKEFFLSFFNRHNCGDRMKYGKKIKSWTCIRCNERMGESTPVYTTSPIYNKYEEDMRRDLNK